MKSKRKRILKQSERRTVNTTVNTTPNDGGCCSVEHKQRTQQHRTQAPTNAGADEPRRRRACSSPPLIRSERVRLVGAQVRRGLGCWVRRSESVPEFVGKKPRRLSSFVGHVFLSAKGENLDYLVKLVKEGKLKTVIDSKHSLSKAEDAWAKSIDGHATEKIIVEP
ncbi:chloroplast envelope quinone oxidoreductase like protein [Quercus suber]|uniref:Chloroplast envelope quinone oxidoreductase like protein n=1 Tax=Quercus suber TaxID=58331 RepID=A0AAW0L7K0_QUESU